MINLYGIIISLSIISALTVSLKISKHKQKEVIWDLALWAVIPGILGARLYHVLHFLDYYFQNPVNIVKIWNGGLGIYGGIAGGLTGLIFYLKKRKLKILHYLDIISIAMPLAQAIGRWGNFFNKEIFGKHTTLPWGIIINNKKHHPLFLYESILNFSMFLFLIFDFKKQKRKDGWYFSTYLAGYSLIRFFLEFLRLAPWKIGTLNVAQLISILIFIPSIYLAHKKAK